MAILGAGAVIAAAAAAGTYFWVNGGLSQTDQTVAALAETSFGQESEPAPTQRLRSNKLVYQIAEDYGLFSKVPKEQHEDLKKVLDLLQETESLKRDTIRIAEACIPADKIVHTLLQIEQKLKELEEFCFHIVAIVVVCGEIGQESMNKMLDQLSRVSSKELTEVKKLSARFSLWEDEWTDLLPKILTIDPEIREWALHCFTKFSLEEVKQGFETTCDSLSKLGKGVKQWKVCRLLEKVPEGKQLEVLPLLVDLFKELSSDQVEEISNVLFQFENADWGDKNLAERLAKEKANLVSGSVAVP